jgi:hypothetical protein
VSKISRVSSYPVVSNKNQTICSAAEFLLPIPTTRLSFVQVQYNAWIIPRGVGHSTLTASRSISGTPAIKTDGFYQDAVVAQ